jgi:ADP-heptose:LPS heptosyltransferase
VHVAAAMNTPTVVLVNRPTPNGYAPVGSHHHVIYAQSLNALTVEEVYNATHRVLNRTNRTASIFAS